MKGFLLSLLAVGAVLVMLMLYLNQPNSLDEHLENAVSEWNKRMDRLFKDFPWR